VRTVPEHLAELGRRQLFPVKQLQHQLRLDRDAPQRREQQPLLALHVEAGRETRATRFAAQLVERSVVEGLAQALADRLAQDVACDRQQPGLEARVATKAVRRLDAAREGALDQLLDLRLAAGLVVEEAPDRGEVALEELAAGSAIAAAPSEQQLAILGHRGRTIGAGPRTRNQPGTASARASSAAISRVSTSDQLGSASAERRCRRAPARSPSSSSAQPSALWA
jgi:hypothetical protein